MASQRFLFEQVGAFHLFHNFETEVITLIRKTVNCVLHFFSNLKRAEQERFTKVISMCRHVVCISVMPGKLQEVEMG